MMKQIDWGLALAIVGGCAIVVLLSGCVISGCAAGGTENAKTKCVGYPYDGFNTTIPGGVQRE